MQFSDFLEFISDPMVVLTMVIIAVAGASVLMVKRRPKGPSTSKIPIVRQMGRMMSDIDKDKTVTTPPVRSRQEIITGLFETEMQTVGLEPSTEAGHIPISSTPLAKFLVSRGVPEDIIEAILTGLETEETEEDVMEIIAAAAESPTVNLEERHLDTAKRLAVEEWSRSKRTSGSSE
jgi:hypothetical protein